MEPLASVKTQLETELITAVGSFIDPTRPGARTRLYHMVREIVKKYRSQGWNVPEYHIDINDQGVATVYTRGNYDAIPWNPDQELTAKKRLLLEIINAFRSYDDNELTGEELAGIMRNHIETGVSLELWPESTKETDFYTIDAGELFVSDLLENTIAKTVCATTPLTPRGNGIVLGNGAGETMSITGSPVGLTIVNTNTSMIIQ